MDKGSIVTPLPFKCHWTRDNESNCSSWWFSMLSINQGCEHDNNYKGCIYTTEIKWSSSHLLSKSTSPAKKHWTSLSRNHLVFDLALARRRPKLIFNLDSVTLLRFKYIISSSCLWKQMWAKFSVVWTASGRHREAEEGQTREVWWRDYEHLSAHQWVISAQP